jgi:hypothetical protein
LGAAGISEIDLVPAYATLAVLVAGMAVGTARVTT